uniref:ATP synthase subunit a n=1 Tax=Prionospio sp. 1 MH-2023 TaxID=3058460 RepID=A0AAU6QFX4_9ANNE
MMVDIFSSFDPATTAFFNFSSTLFWSMNFITVLLIHPMFWAGPSHTFWALSLPMSIMNEQSARTSTSHLKGLTSLLVALYILITMINFLGVIPYVFSTSSHLIFTFSFGLPLWLSLILSSASFSPSTTLAALLPGGAPAWLNPFLILIETVSTVVRPITLSVRLAANMSAGHIVLTLMGVYFIFGLLSFNIPSTLFLFLIQAGYTVFELGICVIQAYIFCLLLSL